MTDMDLKEHVLDALEFEPSIDAADIGVAVEDGVVTLTGHVRTFPERLAAERAVARVKGVKAIAEEIEVRPEGSHLTADDEIAKRALSVLHWNTAVPDDSIRVTVTRGAVTLSGTVEWNYQREAAEDALRGIVGITGILNHIEVRPATTARNVREQIEKALRRDAELEAEGIRIEVKDGVVRLEGEVHSLHERRAIRKAAWAVPGVTRVEDGLRVV